MRRALLGLVLALGFSGAAQAAAFVVVSSNEPSIRTGESLEAGAHVALPAGKSLTVIRTSGEVTTLHGGPGGAVLPGAMIAQADPARFDTLKALFQRPPTSRTFGARRGFCPGPEGLSTMDAILLAYQNGCQGDARAALKIYLQSQGAPAAVDAPPPPQ